MKERFCRFAEASGKEQVLKEESSFGAEPKKQVKEALAAAFPHTLPVLTGFSFLGIAYGILMSSKGYGVGWTALFSIICFAGSAQYLAITFLTTAFNPIYALLMTLMVNARHIFYGISLLDKYKGMGGFKPYLIFGLCDETFSLVCAVEPPRDVDKGWFTFFITLLDHLYWVSGSVIGALVGAMISFDTTGLDFVLTALFIVIFLGQWREKKDHTPAMIGIAASFVALLLFGPDHFIIPAMVLIIAILTFEWRRKKNRNQKEEAA